MMNYDFVTESMRLHLTEQNRMVFRGFSRKIIRKKEHLKYM